MQAHVKTTGPTKSNGLLPIRKKGKDSKKPSMRPIHIPLEPAERSPPRSRVPLGPAGQISASLEATPRHKGQTAPPPNRSPYEGIKSQPLHHGSKCGRRQATTPTVDVTGVPSADSGHHSAIPDAVAAPWDLRRGTRQARYCSRRPSGPASHRKGGFGDVMCPPDLLVCTPALRPGGPGPTGAIPAGQDEIQDNSDARRLPTVYFLQCPTTVLPRFRGKRRLPCPHSCAPPLFVTIKGGGGLPFLWPVSLSLASLFQEDVQGLLRTHLNRLHF